MNLHFLMAFEHDEIMAVALVVTKEEILAMGRIYFLPIFEGKFNRRKRRMGVKLVIEAMILKEGQDFVDAWISCHLLMLFAKWVGAAFFFSGCTILAGCFLM